MDGFDTSIFSYGTIGTGKTFTMIGSEEVKKFLQENSEEIPISLENKLGIIPKICIDLIKQINDLNFMGNSCLLKISYLENYLDTINCLITGRKNIFQGWGVKEEIKYKEDSEPKKVECKNISDVINVLSKGLKNIKTNSLSENWESSRSHTFLILELEVTYLDGKKTKQKMLLGDLAGSNRVF